MSAKEVIALSSEPPIYTINLSLPPRDRYKHVALDYRGHISSLTGLFDELVHDVSPAINPRHVAKVARLLLRRVYSKEQTEELMGISEAAGVEMFLLVCLNTLLDCFMGCSSGGFRMKRDPREELRENGHVDDSTIVHLRTLDWGMDPLRKVVVRYDFVEKEKGDVIASSLSYVGYVGCLTGVRKNLSISLNFRGNHSNPESILSNIKYRAHQAAVVLGLRPSIASDLRDFLLPVSSKNRHDHPAQAQSATELLKNMQTRFTNSRTSAAYIIACSSQSVVIFEKDLISSSVRSGDSMLVATNHDVSLEDSKSVRRFESTESRNLAEWIEKGSSAYKWMIEESIDRKQCLEGKWKRAEKRWFAAQRQSQPKAADSNETMNTKDRFAASERQLKSWLLAWPTTNESTHYACVMDPAIGEFRYARVWQEALEPPTDTAVGE